MRLIASIVPFPSLMGEGEGEGQFAIVISSTVWRPHRNSNTASLQNVETGSFV